MRPYLGPPWTDSHQIWCVKVFHHALPKYGKNSWKCWKNIFDDVTHFGTLYHVPVHKGANHVPKAVSDHDPLPDWVRDVNYVRSHALQLPSQSRTGSGHCEVIFHSYCADWPFDPCMALACTSKIHTHKSRSKRALHSHVLRIRFSRQITIEIALFFAFQKPDLKELCIHKG